MSNVHKNLEILGYKVVDKVTGFKGVATSVCYELYGCIQVVVTPAIDKDGNEKAGKWFDITRLQINGKEPVTQVPNFDSGYISEGKKGSALNNLPDMATH